MDTLTIKIRNSKTLKLIRDLESLNLIQVINNTPQKPAKKLSSEMEGSISEEQANSMQKELKHLRNESRDEYFERLSKSMENASNFERRMSNSGNEG